MSERSGELLVRLRAELEEITRLPVLVEDFAARNGLPEAIAPTLTLVLEELVVNTITYGYDDGDDAERRREGAVEIRLSRRGNVVTIEVEDDARPFDPLQREPPDTEAALDEREPGGLGIHLVRTLMDTVEYRRIGDRNRLTMTKTAADPSKDG